MEDEERITRRFLSLENTLRKRESMLMAMEESAKAREIYRFIDLDNEQERESSVAISVSVQKGYEVVQSRRFERVNRGVLNAATAVWRDKMKARVAAYDGPPAGMFHSIEISSPYITSFLIEVLCFAPTGLDWTTLLHTFLFAL